MDVDSDNESSASSGSTSTIRNAVMQETAVPSIGQSKRKAIPESPFDENIHSRKSRKENLEKAKNWKSMVNMIGFSTASPQDPSKPITGVIPDIFGPGAKANNPVKALPRRPRSKVSTGTRSRRSSAANSRESSVSSNRSASVSSQSPTGSSAPPDLTAVSEEPCAEDDMEFEVEGQSVEQPHLAYEQDSDASTSYETASRASPSPTELQNANGYKKGKGKEKATNGDAVEDNIGRLQAAEFNFVAPTALDQGPPTSTTTSDQPPASGDTGISAMLGYVSHGFQLLTTAIHTQSQSPTQHALAKEVAALRKAFEQTNSQRTEPLSIEEDVTMKPPPRKGPNAKKKPVFVPVSESESENDDPPRKPHRNDDLNNFTASKRLRLLSRRNISDLKYLKTIQGRCKLTDEQREAFETRHEDCIKITADNFRLDLIDDRDSLFNTEAVHVFATSFLDKVVNHGWYPNPGINAKYRDVDEIATAFYSHLKHVKARYSEQTAKDSSKKVYNRQRDTARSGRKGR
ncbi:hypothetical protein BV22DRAFT_1051364, partial [Leucogyrophana mollusca]